jgi:peptidyl-prolyl cis-trans isomerase C
VARLDYLEDKALRRAYFTDVIAKDITPEIVKKAYDDFVANFKSVQEWRARHILVASLEDAQKIIAEIVAGKDFETAALENSSDSNSAKRGGDLGYFRHKDMTALFEEAAIALKVGQMSAPVKTEFGWHIIKLEDDRMSLPPSFEQVQAQLAQQQLVERFNNDLINLKKDMEIEVMDKDIEAAILAEQQKN